MTKVWFYNKDFTNIVGAEISDEDGLIWHKDFMAAGGLDLFHIDLTDELAGFDEAEDFLKSLSNN